MNGPEASLEKGAIHSLPGPEHPYAVLRNRNFLLYLIGRFIASMGHPAIQRNLSEASGTPHGKPEPRHAGCDGFRR